MVFKKKKKTHKQSYKKKPDMHLSETAQGYIGVAIAILFFGSNYAVAKRYPVSDGIAFAWLMSCGILIVGFITIAIVQQNFVFVPTGTVTDRADNWNIQVILVLFIFFFLFFYY